MRIKIKGALHQFIASSLLLAYLPRFGPVGAPPAMASLLFKDKKGGGGVNFSCASPASAAVCTSIDLRSTIHPAGGSGGRALDRHTLHLQDPRRRPKSAAPSSIPHTPTKPKTVRPKSSEKLRSGTLGTPGSMRYLLGGEEDGGGGIIVDGAYLEEGGRELAPLVSLDPPTLKPLTSELIGSKACSVSAAAFASASERQNQVVVLRVSLHCKGCEGNVRKHISKMEGVTSFEIDFTSKKVTVVGDVTPLGVLNSIAKVKHAQFWSSPAPPSDLIPGYHSNFRA
ncbi:protein SODIUM POTASSIUM ROOT DEFECTIVE 2-like [Zingiber officinale]|uniref:protein SODIUM POTASSIUM ROOT DEFECTIVE 2-like n=1 Tax=Zingiber officinale TaxID=94328 RepID=UPI001C4D66C3|nr:protein SODIUM POTASSIUM ROOT DEFECTIVE 2-like [Zingiber officinale]